MKLKNWLLVPIVFLLVTVLAISVTARVRKADLFELDTQKNMSVSVEYDTEPPQVYFIDPDGNEIKDALVADTGSVLYFKLPDAMPGQWKIAYDKGSNEELTVSYAPYFIGAAIEAFSFTQTENKIINVKFNVNSELDQYYNFAIYAVAMNGDAVDGQLLLKNGSAILGREEDFDIRLSDLETYDHYHLMLEIWYDQDGTELFDTAIAEGEFSYVNEDTPAALENVKVNVDSDDGITVDWSEYSKYCEKYLLSIFEGNATEPVFY